MSKKIKNIIFSVLLLIFTIFICLAVFEKSGELWLGKEALQIVEDVDHRMSPNTKNTNSDGILCQFESNHFKQKDYNIIFLGDSFTYGFLVTPDKAFPQQIESIARNHFQEKHINVANFGWVSSSPLLSYRLLKDIGEKYNPDLVILNIDMTDFTDDISYTRLLDKTGIYRIRKLCPVLLITIKKVLRRLQLKKIHEWLFGPFVIKSERYVIANKPLPQTIPYYSYTRRYIENINNFCKTKLNAEFVLVILPRSFQYSDRESPNSWEKGSENVVPLGPYVKEPFKYFENIKAEVDYPIYSLLPDFQNANVFPTCFDDDPHWNNAGHKIAAKAIFTDIKPFLKKALSRSSPKTK